MVIKQATNKNGSVFRIFATPTCGTQIYEIERKHTDYEGNIWWSLACNLVTADLHKIETEFNNIINSNY